MNIKKNLKLLCCVLLLTAISLSSGAAETMGLYQVTPGKGHSTYFDTVAWTYTRPGYFNVQIFFGKQNTQKDTEAGKGNNQFFIELTPEQYAKIFSGSKTLNELKIKDHMWDRTFTAASNDNIRTVGMSFTNAIDDEITEVFKRGRMEIVMSKDKINSIKFFVEQKRFMSLGGYKKVFVGEARNLKKVVDGLSLRDEGEVGRVNSVTGITAALKDKTGKGFKEAVTIDKR